MPTDTTLSDFTSPDPGSPAGRLRDLMDEADIPMLGEAVMHGQSPPGMDAATECEDIRVLEQYVEFLRENCPGDYFGESPISKRAAEPKYTAIDTVESRIEKLTFPSPDEWPDPLDEQYLDFVDDLEYPQKQSPVFDWYGWAEVNTLSTKTLTFLCDAYKTVRHPDYTSTRESPLMALLYYRDDTEITVDDLFDISRRGDGARPSVVRGNLVEILDSLHPVIGAMLVTWVDDITTKKGKKDAAGTYTNQDHERVGSPTTLNVTSDGRIQQSEERNTTAHEIGHALHYLYGFKGGTTKNANPQPNSWDPDETLTVQDSFRVTVLLEWDRLRDGAVEPLRDYQLTNIHEFIACAFECWVCDPDHLTEVQPRMKQLFDAHFGPTATPSS